MTYMDHNLPGYERGGNARIRRNETEWYLREFLHIVRKLCIQAGKSLHESSQCSHALRACDDLYTRESTYSSSDIVAR